MVVGVLTLVWVVVVWRWQDPFTAIYTAYEQHELVQSYDRRAKAFLKAPAPSLPPRISSPNLTPPHASA